jgi:sigma-B regulation protein RsbU (phosphoserine phosphatase)
MPFKILVVDDEPDLEILVKQNFRRKIRQGEYEFVFAQNGKIALQRLEEHPDIDVMMSDINMPEMDGLTLLSEIIAKYPLLRSIIVSAYGDMKNLRTAMNNGAYDFVTKPIDFEDLERTIIKTINEVTNIKEAEKTKEQLTFVQRELQIGRQIQESFLPNAIPKVVGWDFVAHFQPAKEVAGDFYDIFEIEDGKKICFVLGDVCGKGVGSALFMTLMRSLIHAYGILHTEESTRTLSIIQMTHDYITSIHDEANMFATIFFGILDKESGEFEYINCGHNPPLLFGANGNITQLEHSGPVVGMFPSNDFLVKKDKIENGGMLFIYSDGATDAINSAEDIFGEERLCNVVTNNRQNNAGAILTTIMNTLAEFSGPVDQFDDITLMILKH